MSKSQEELAERLLALARAYVMTRAPYIAQTLYALKPVPLYETCTMGVTEGLVFYYNPKFIAEEPSFHTVNADGLPNGHEVLGACLYHECWHPIRGIDRIRALPNKKLANLAGDMPINHDLRSAKWRLPPWVVYPESFRLKPGHTLEQYYAQLEQNQEAAEFMASASVGSGDSSEQGSGGEVRKGPCSGQCGGVGGSAANEELEKSLDAAYGRHEAEVEQVRAATQRDINSYIQAKGRGSAPGFSQEEIKFKKQEFPINWRRELSYVMIQASGRIETGGADFSYARPSKRSLLLGVVRPGLIDQLPEIAFVRDTSGSMGQQQLNSANNVVISVMKRLGIDEVWLLDADTEVQRKPTRVHVKDIPLLDAKGRGGTSFIKPLEAVTKIRPRPNLCIYLTDGDGTAPAHPPKGMPVIWCIVPTPYGRKPASWGRTVVCSNDKELRNSYE